MQNNMDHYISGVCNIGPAEIRLRKLLGWCGLVITVVLWALLIRLREPVWWRSVLFITAFFSANGFFQGYMHFCAGFGMRGVFNFGPKIGETETVLQAELRAQDRRKARTILAYAAAAAVVVTLPAFFI